MPPLLLLGKKGTSATSAFDVGPDGVSKAYGAEILGLSAGRASEGMTCSTNVRSVVGLLTSSAPKAWLDHGHHAVDRSGTPPYLLKRPSRVQAEEAGN
mmetsp:Transcript_50617/g.117537  ORF Transcript_50617/g.117537 Transcript_50617/m.117537 type:complete len:98 (+) Transcript_50617:366-659(+)